MLIEVKDALASIGLRDDIDYKVFFSEPDMTSDDQDNVQWCMIEPLGGDSVHRVEMLNRMQVALKAANFIISHTVAEDKEAFLAVRPG